MEPSDTARALWAARRFIPILTDHWPAIASHLVADGFGGAATVEMACLPSKPGRWDVEPLIPDVLAEIGAIESSDEDAAMVVARLLAMTTLSDNGLLGRLDGLAVTTQRQIEPFRSAAARVDEMDMAMEFPHGTSNSYVSHDVVRAVRELGPLAINPELLPYVTGIGIPRQ